MVRIRNLKKYSFYFIFLRLKKKNNLPRTVVLISSYLELSGRLQYLIAANQNCIYMYTIHNILFILLYKQFNIL